MTSAEDTLLPGREVKLFSGKYVRIEPWSMKVGRRVLEPVNRILQVSAKFPSAKIPELIDKFWDEMRQIVKVTLDWDDAELDELLLEDFVELSTVILEVCLARDDGGGLMAKMMRFGNQGGHVLLTAALGPEKAAAVMEANQAATATIAEPKRREQQPSQPGSQKTTHSHRS